jgi:anaerobic dimethyl sulfoxide reductase subunit C (anchor subunit)
MEARQLALITFTILTQMSVGAFLILGFVHFFVARKAGVEEADRMSDRALLSIGPVIVLALIASLFHLGNPLNAPRAVTNLDTSWLSREILFSVLFVLLGGVFALMQWRKVASFAVRNVIAWIATLVGLAAVYSMSQIYMLETQPAWNTWATPVTFFVTMLLLGLLSMGAALVANYAYVQRQDPECAAVQCELLRSTVRWVALTAVLVLGVELIVVPIYLGSLSTGGNAAQESARLLVQDYGVLFALRLVLTFIGAGVFGFFLYQNAASPGRERIMGNLVYAAFALVLVSEVLGRFLFYATQVQLSI